MPLFNLLQSVPEIQRDVSARLVNKEQNREIACQFGFEYFDGPREQGYGGYIYDGRWVKISKSAKARYSLQPGMRILDIGCAKGYFVYDLSQEISGLEAFGMDVSEYALSHAKPEIKDKLLLGSAHQLPFPDDSFDAVCAINTIHNLEPVECQKAIKEIVRVCKYPQNCFIQVDAYRTREELQLFEAWMLTAKTYLTPSGWEALFEESEYEGDYFWTILKPETSEYLLQPNLD